MKRKAKLAAFLLAVIWVVSGIPTTAEAAAPVKLLKSSVTLNITTDGKKTTYGTSTIKIKKSKGIKIQKTTYKSANKKIATVTKKGKVTAKKKGNTKITATVRYKKGKKTYTKKLAYKVMVKAAKEDKKIQSLNKTIEVGESISLGISGVTSCYSSNNQVATVSNDTIKGVHEGNAIVTITTNSMIYSINVTVMNSSIEVQNVLLNKSTCSMKVGESQILNATITPSNATDKTVIWNSYDTSVVTVSNGLLKAVKEGNTQVTVSTRNGKLAICNVTVMNDSLGSSTENPVEPDIPKKPEILSLGEFTISGGTKKSVYYDNSDESITSQVIWKVESGDKKSISEYGSGNDGSPFSYVHVKGNIQGDVVVGAYYNDELLATATVHVTSSNPDFVAYEEWKAQKKQELWTSDMTDKEKVLAFAGYNITHRKYGSYDFSITVTEGVSHPLGIFGYANENNPTECITASAFIVDIADDLGLEGKYINYAGRIENHPSAFGNQHVMAYIHFADGWHTIEACPDAP